MQGFPHFHGAVNPRSLKFDGTNKITFLFSTGDSGIYECENEGDSGATPGQQGNLNFPASDFAVLAVGGTSLSSTGTPKRWTNETGWSCPTSPETACYQSGNGASGGGTSMYFGYQGANSFTWRTTPDISMNADPNTGMAFLTVWSKGKGYYASGGTSASTPFMAGVLALVAQKNKTKIGYFNPFLYSHTSNTTWLFDVTQGYNGTNAGVGYDMVTGFGSLKDGAALATAFGAP